MYWVAKVKLTAAAVGVVGLLGYGSFALYEGSWSLRQHNIVHQQGLNNAQYSADQQTQQYQQTYRQQADKTYQQIVIDKYDIDQAKAAGDTTGEQDGYAAVQADIHTFCTDASLLDTTTKAELTPQESALYYKAC